MKFRESIRQLIEGDRPDQPRLPKGLILVIAIAVGGLGLVVYALASARHEENFGAGLGAIAHSFGVGLMIAGAAFFIGTLAGFLFGIPRSQQPDARSEQGAADASDDNTANRAGLQVNTNLEQISDWLTKILVGVGLTQLNTLPEKLADLSAFLGAAFGTGDNHEAFAISLATFYGVTGFLFGYLATRLFLQRDFLEADNAAQQVAARVDDIALLQQMPGAESGTEPLQEKMKTAADNVRKLPLSALKTVGQLTAWAKAQVVAENYNEAAEAYRRAQSLDPGNTELHLELLRTQTLAGGRTPEVAAQLKQAQQQITQGRIYNALYQPPPDGFQAAIQIGEEYLQDFPENATVLVYLAAGYGQKYKWEQEHNAGPDALGEIRAKALSAARKAIELAPNKKYVLQMLWNPSFKGKDPEEDDLEVFSGDEEFKALLS